jgi:large subunit ribosomal protein L4
MKVDVFNMKGETVDKIDLPAAIFEAPIKVDLMHQAFERQMANARAGTHSTKTRGEVRGGGRKPWRQKGTGRARQGSIRAPNWVGGGKVHTPKPRSYRKDMPKKMRRAALRAALSAKAAEAEIVVLDELKLAEIKTKAMASALQSLVGDDSVLILMAASDEIVEKSTRNLADAKTLRAEYLNIRDLLGYKRLLLPLSALETISAHLGA